MRRMDNLSEVLGNAFSGETHAQNDTHSASHFEIDIGTPALPRTVLFLYLGTHPTATIGEDRIPHVLMPFQKDGKNLISDGLITAVKKDSLPEELQPGEWITITGYTYRGIHTVKAFQIRTDLERIAPNDRPRNLDIFNINPEPVGFAL